METLLHKNLIYQYVAHTSEEDYEKEVIGYAKNVFGLKSIYVDVKKRIKNEGIVSIPDGYLIDLTFATDPRLYIVEIELVTHDPFKHIGQQLLKFSTSYKASGREIKRFILEDLMRNVSKKRVIEGAVKSSGHRNIDAFMDHLIFEKPVAAIVIIDELTVDLENVLRELTMPTETVEFRIFAHKKDRIILFTPFQQDIRTITESRGSNIKPEDIDTIVVPAREEGFKRVFIGENSWYEIRISSSMIDKIKYIASYQAAPISAITHYAEVASIKKYKGTNKYIVYFKGKAKHIPPIKIDEGVKGLAPQAPRYTNINKLLKAKTLKDVF